MTISFTPADHASLERHDVDKRDILDRIEFFRDAPPGLKSAVLEAARDVRLARGELLFREGEPARHVSIVGTGSIRVFRTGASGRQIVLYHVRPGQASLASLVSVMLDMPAVATGEAETDTELVTVAASAIRDWVAGTESVRRFAFETMSRALVDIASLVEDLGSRTMEARLAAALLGHAGPDRTVRMRHEDLADELGTAREVVSRLLEAFARSGAIALSRGRIEIVDPGRLLTSANAERRLP